MESIFDKLYFKLIREADEKEMPEPDSAEDSAGAPPEAPEGDMEQGQDMGMDDMEGMEDEGLADDAPVFPEELELAKLAVRALYFNIASKDVHQYKMKIDGKPIPFDKISDYFESTKNWKPIVQFVEWIMDKFEGISSKWTEQPEIRGKSILQKIKKFKHLDSEQVLDNGKRLYWVRIILNCLMSGNPDFNLVISDVNEKNIGEIFNLLKMHFGRDTRGIDQDVKTGPGIF